MFAEIYINSEASCTISVVPILNESGAASSSLKSACMLSVAASAVISAALVSSVQAKCGLFGESYSLAASASSGVKSSCDITFISTKTDSISGSPVSSLTAKCTLAGYGVVLSGAGTSGLTATCAMDGNATKDDEDAVLANESRPGLTMASVINDILLMWAISDRECAPEFAVTRAINDLNSALQMIWNQAEARDYFTSTTLTITFAANETTKTLPVSIQNVTGPCRIATSKRPLAPVGSIGELESFQSLYLDGDPVSEPVAYYIDRNRQSGSDPVKCDLVLTPAPSATTHIILCVVKEAPRYVLEDIKNDTTIPIPLTYAESLLMPITRYRASSFFLFSDKDLKETIDRDYVQAMKLIGLADPLPGKAGDNENKREEHQPA